MFRLIVTTNGKYKSTDLCVYTYMLVSPPLNLYFQTLSSSVVLLGGGVFGR
jgi:hypothetical protein